MSRARVIAFVPAAAVLASGLALAQSLTPTVESVTVTATVQAVDRVNRLVTLKGEKGRVVTVQVGDEVKRLDELHVGDTVRATYAESIAVYLRRPGEPVPQMSSGSATTPSPGDPGATATAQDTVTVTVVSVDKEKRSVTLKRKDGSEVTMRVENPKYLEAVKPGDTVDVTYTRALLLRVEPVR